MTGYIMKRTDILCIECLKKNLIHEKGDSMYCDGCGTQFVIKEYNKDGTPKVYGYKQGGQ